MSKTISELLNEEGRKIPLEDKKIDNRIRKLEDENKKLKLIKQDGLEKATRGVVFLVVSFLPASLFILVSYLATNSYEAGLQLAGIVTLVSFTGYMNFKLNNETNWGE